MNLQLLNNVLGLSVGETRILREPHLFPMRVHRYRDGWTFLLDNAPDRAAVPRAVLGWFLNRPEDVADFLIGELGCRINQFGIIGDRA